MQCPVCNVALVMSDRNGIEIDYCPQCRGVWLDRGELDKIIERSAGPAPANHHAQQPQYQQQQYQQPQHQQRHHDYDDDDDHYGHHDSHHGHKKHKKEGFLGDLFDF